MQPHELVVRQALYWFALAVVAPNLVLSALRVAGSPGAYVDGFAPTVLVVLAVLVGWSVVTAYRGVGAVTPLRWIVAVCCVALAAHPWVTGESPLPYPPLMPVLGAGMVISAMVGVGASLVIIPAFSLGVALLRAPYMGLLPAASEALLLAISGFVGTLCVDLFQRAGRSVQRTVESTWVLVEESARAARRALERERWDGLVHDKVLGALKIASRAPGEGVPEAAQSLAREALAAFRGEPADPTGSTDLWRRHAERLGLAVAFDVTGEVTDPEVRDAVVAAVIEALTNVARHSGQGTARVAGSLGDDRVRLAVTDPGRGFAPRRTPPGVGLRTSVVARMRSVGGRAEIRSAPGRGTRIRLAWDRAAREPAAPSSEWHLRTVVPFLALGVIVLALNVVRGHGQWSSVAVPGVAVAGIVVIVLLTAMAGALPAVRQVWVPFAVVVTVTVLVLALITPPDAPLDWRYWYLGAVTPAVAAASYRFPPGIGVGTAVLATAIVAVVDAAAGREYWAFLVGSAPGLLITSVGAHLMRRALDAAWRRVEESTRRDAELRVAIAVEEERERESAERVAALAGTVGPVLGRLAAGAGLTASEAREADLLEAAVRDQLVAPGLVDVDLSRRIGAARAAGVRVDVAGEDDRPGDGLPDGGTRPRAWRAVLHALLGAAPRGTSVRVVWAPAGGTIGAVGPEMESVLAAVSEVVRELDGVRLSGDEDSLLVEF